MRRLIASFILAALPAQIQAESGPGAHLFLEGVGATALIANGSVEVSAAQFACAGCHGEDARGGREGATAFPSLIDATQPRFDRATFVAAVQEGVGADGRRLAASMPRYRTNPETLDSLYDYISALAGTGRVGVKPRILRIAPPSDRALQLPFFKGLEEANRAGGVWGRMFQISDTPGDAIISGDEVLKRLDVALAKELAGSVAAELERRNVDIIAFDGRDEDFVAALQGHGVDIDPDASSRIGLIQEGAVISDDEGNTRMIPFALTGAANPTHLVPSEKANLAAREITFAATACGRGVTRRCLLDRLGANYPSR